MEQKVDVKVTSIKLNDCTLTTVVQETITTALAEMCIQEWAEAIRSARELKDSALEKKLLERAKTFGVKVLADCDGLFLIHSQTRNSGYNGRIIQI